MTIKKVQSGDRLKIPAAAYNTMADAAESHKASQLNQSPGQDQPGDNLVLVKNYTYADLDSGKIVGIDEPLFSPDDNLNEFKYNFSIKGVVPTASHEGKFIVIAEPIAAYRIGRGYIFGVCPALVDIADETYHDYAEIVDGKLKSVKSGSARILWQEAGTGADKWAILQLGINPKELTIDGNPGNVLTLVNTGGILQAVFDYPTLIDPEA